MSCGRSAREGLCLWEAHERPFLLTPGCLVVAVGDQAQNGWHVWQDRPEDYLQGSGAAGKIECARLRKELSEKVLQKPQALRVLVNSADLRMASKSRRGAARMMAHLPAVRFSASTYVIATDNEYSNTAM